MKHRKNLWKRCLGAAAVLTLICSAPAGAASLSDYDEEVRERLLDNVLEYGEIRARVSLFNPSMQQTQMTMDDSLEIYRNGMTEYKERAAELRRERDKAEEEGDLEAYMNYEMNAQILIQIANQYEDVVEGAERMSAQRSVVSAEDMLTRGVQQMVQGYAQLEQGCRTAAKAAELAEAAFRSAQTRQSLGMATEDEVRAAENSLESAKAGLKAAEDSRNSLKSSICMMTGWDYNADIEIGPVPEPDMEAVRAADPETDTEKAVNNNYELISVRHGSRATSTPKQEMRDRNLRDGEAAVRISMESLYGALTEQAAAKEGADAAWEAAQKERAALDQKYGLGMIGRLEYLQGELTYLQAEGAKLASDISMRKAYEDYLWQIKGLSIAAE